MSKNVIRAEHRWQNQPESQKKSGSLPPSGGGGDNGDMDRLAHLERRVDRIDDRLERIEGDVSAMKTSLASMDAKLDISGIRSSVEKAHTDIYKWIVSILAIVGAIYFGLQRVSAPPPQQPIVIQTPQPATQQPMPQDFAPKS